MEFYELQQIVESNSRAIQAELDAQAAARLEREELRESGVRVDAAILRLEDAIGRLITLNEGISNLISSLDSDRPTILTRLRNIENKVDRILEQSKPPTQEQP